MKKQIRWTSEKAMQLSNDAARGNISFEDCVIAIEDGRVLDDIPNPNYSNQRMLILNINNYVYVVP
jgi:putative NADH-flavin reductase